jgi:hypothetical protein
VFLFPIGKLKLCFCFPLDTAEVVLLFPIG